VSNLVKDIRDGLENLIESTCPNFKKSRYIWDFQLNNERTSGDIYAVRPNSGSSTTGTNKTITINQTFEVLLSSKFKNVSDKDSALDLVIMGLYEEHEKLEKVLFQRNINIARVLVVESIDLSSPDIDNDNNSVTITASYVIKYRNETL
jgi:hypothetical protein